MSGAGGGSGYNYQADAFAYAASYALAGTSLNWAGRPDDFPVAIKLETGSPGDDLVIEMANTSRLEVQAKFHARLDKKLTKSLVRLFHGLTDPSLRGVLLLDSDSSKTISRDLRRDFKRLSQGRTDGISKAGKSFLRVLSAEGLHPDASVFDRLHIVVLNLERNSMGEEAGLNALRAVLEDQERAGDAWQRLGKLGLERTGQSGRSDVTALVGFLEPTIRLRRTGTSAAAVLLHYRTWLNDTLGFFPVIGFKSARLASTQAWDEMLEIPDEDTTVMTLAEEFRRYHETKSDSSGSTYDMHLRADDVILMGEDCVVVGAAGSGKSTLVRRLVVSAIEEGLLPFRVPLKTLASRLKEVTFDEALCDVALQGSGVPASGRQLLAPTLLIADGLDECGERRSEIAEYLRAWRHGHPEARVIVATRSFGYARADFPTFVHAELKPLTDHAIFDLAQHIFLAQGRPADEALEEASRFENALQTNHAAAVAARTPLLLGCLAALFAQGRPLPDRRARLFRDVTDVLRDQQVGRLGAIVVSEAVADRVMEIAGWLLVEEPTLAKSTLRDRIGEQLWRDGLTISPLAGADLAGKALIFWEDRRLVERLTTGVYEIVTFVHLNLAEYAAGRFASRLDPAEIAAWIRRVHADPRWREPVLLSAGSGASTTIIQTLLSAENANEAESKAALLAADALAESTNVPLDLVESVIAALSARLLLPTTEAVVAAAERLIVLVEMSPVSAAASCKPLLDHERPVVRLAAEAITFAATPAEIPARLPQRWLESYLPVLRFRFGKQPLPPHNEDIPAEADDLYERTVGLALSALFQTSQETEALAVATRFLQQKHGLDMLSQLEGVMARYGHHDLFCELTTSIQSRFPVPVFNTARHQATIMALLDSIAANVGAPDESGSQVTYWRYIRRVLSAVEFWHFDEDFEELDDEERSLLAFAVGRTIHALGIPHDALRRELASAYDVARNLPPRGIYGHARPIRVKPNWKRAAKPIDGDRVCAALMNASALVNWVGANLLEAGAAAGREEEIIRHAILKGRRRTLFWLTQIAPELTDVMVTARALAERLSTNPNRSCVGILQALDLESVSLLRLASSRALLEPLLTSLAGSEDKELARAATAALVVPLGVGH